MITLKLDEEQTSALKKALRVCAVELKAEDKHTDKLFRRSLLTRNDFLARSAQLGSQIQHIEDILEMVESEETDNE